MKIVILTLSLIALAVLSLLAACSSPESRIKKEPGKLLPGSPPAQQELIKQGRVALGFDKEMVKLALGDPDRVRTRVDATGMTEVWHYVTYYTDSGTMIYTGYYHRGYYGGYGYYGGGPWGWGWGGIYARLGMTTPGYALCHTTAFGSSSAKGK